MGVFIDNVSFKTDDAKRVADIIASTDSSHRYVVYGQWRGWVTVMLDVSDETSATLGVRLVAGQVCKACRVAALGVQLEDSDILRCWAFSDDGNVVVDVIVDNMGARLADGRPISDADLAAIASLSGSRRVTVEELSTAIARATPGILECTLQLIVDFLGIEFGGFNYTDAIDCVKSARRLRDGKYDPADEDIILLGPPAKNGMCEMN